LGDSVAPQVAVIERGVVIVCSDSLSRVLEIPRYILELNQRFFVLATVDGEEGSSFLFVIVSFGAKARRGKVVVEFTTLLSSLITIIDRFGTDTQLRNLTV